MNYEAIIERLDCDSIPSKCPYYSQYGENCGTCGDEAMDDAAKAMRELLDKETTPISKWISVKDRLPELPAGNWVSRTVIAAQGDGNVSPMIYERVLVRNKPVERWLFSWGKIADIKVTHWQPLPEPPEEEE